jgi:hypothetical protein
MAVYFSYGEGSGQDNRVFEKKFFPKLSPWIFQVAPIQRISILEPYLGKYLYEGHLKKAVNLFLWRVEADDITTIGGTIHTLQSQFGHTSDTLSARNNAL